jgi:hypothetical protein
MNNEKYIGLDVHQATISVAVLDSTGKLVMESILETKAATILEFFAGLRGTLSVTFEEGTWAAWLYDLLKPQVAKLVVCNPRKNALLKDGNKSDRIDAHKLAELLYLNKLSSVYHGETGVRMLRELARSYLTIVKDLSRVMNRLKAVYRTCQWNPILPPRWLLDARRAQYTFRYSTSSPIYFSLFMEGVPFVGNDACAHNLLLKGRPLIMRLRQLAASPYK